MPMNKLNIIVELFASGMVFVSTGEWRVLYRSGPPLLRVQRFHVEPFYLNGSVNIYTGKQTGPEPFWVCSVNGLIDPPQKVLSWIQEQVTCRTPEVSTNPELHRLANKYERYQCNNYCKRREKYG